MSASRSPSCWRQRRRSARTRWRRSRSRSRICRRSPTGPTAAKNQSLLFEAPGTNRSLVFEARKGDADAAFAQRALRAARAAAHRPPLRPDHGAARRHGRVGRTPQASSRSPAPPRCRSSTAASWRSRSACRKTQIDMIENDVGGGYGARGEFYPEDFLIPFAARHVNRPVKWIEDRRENLMAMNHAREAEADLEIACARDGTILASARRGAHRHGRLHAHQRRGRRAQRLRSSWPGRIACRTSRSTRRSG